MTVVRGVAFQVDLRLGSRSSVAAQWRAPRRVIDDLQAERAGITAGSADDGGSRVLASVLVAVERAVQRRAKEVFTSQRRPLRALVLYSAAEVCSSFR